MNYTVLNENTQKAQHIINGYKRASATSLFEVYKSYSYYKARAEKEIKDSMAENDGSDYRIISYCINNFTCGYKGAGVNKEGKKCRGLFYFTKNSTIFIPDDDIVKNSLLSQFNKLYKDCIPLAFQLDGFSHAVYFIDCKKKTVLKEESSGYMSASERAFYKSFTDRAKLLFNHCPHYEYQNNAREIVIHEPEEIDSLISRL